MRFALIGKIDVNRDGKDDRAGPQADDRGGRRRRRLRPPAARFGKETGKLTAAIAWYVIDERMPFVSLQGKSDASIAAREPSSSRSSGEAIKEARLNGVRPMPIEPAARLPRLRLWHARSGAAPRPSIAPRLRRIVEPRKPAGAEAARPTRPSRTAPKPRRCRPLPRPRTQGRAIPPK